MEGLGNISKAQNNVKDFILYLNDEMELDIKDIQLNFSGSKGFHVRIPASIFGNFESSKELPQKHKSLAKNLKLKFSCIDTKIYHHCSLIRIPNTLNSKSGLFAIPMDVQEIFDLDVNQIVKLAQNVRILNGDLNLEIQQNINLINIYNTQTQIIKKNKKEIKSKILLNKEQLKMNKIYNEEEWTALETNCNVLKNILTKGETAEKIDSNERYFLGAIAQNFGEYGRTKVHHILSKQENYSIEKTNYHLNQIAEKKYKVPSCKNICNNPCEMINKINGKRIFDIIVKPNDEFNQSILTNLFITKYKDILFYYHLTDSFFIYKNGYYNEIKDEQLAVIINSFLPIYCEETEITQEKIFSLVKRLKISEDINYYGELNPNKFLVNLKNGIYNVKTGEFQEHSPKYIMTTQINVEYDPEAKAPLYSEKINEIFDNDEDKVNYWLQWQCYTLIPTYAHQKFLTLYGTGRNGKGVLTNVLASILGTKNIANENFTDLAENRHYSLINLKNKLVNFASELSSKETDIDTIKRLTGEDIISTRDIYRKKEQFKNFARIIVSTNTLPRVTNLDKAFIERIEILHFTKSFEKNADTSLHEKLEAEKSGILNLILSQRDQLIDEFGNIKLKTPVSIQKVKLEFTNQMHSVTEFISENCQTDESQKFNATLLVSAYGEYKEWAEKSGYKPVGKKIFQEVVATNQKCKVEEKAYVKDKRGYDFKTRKWIIGLKIIEGFNLIEADLTPKDQVKILDINTDFPCTQATFDDNNYIEVSNSI